MPHRQRHRGAHPEDRRLFGPRALPRLQRAAEEVVWLLDHGYKMSATAAFVGNHHQLDQRQRIALHRSLCSSPARQQRLSRALPLPRVRGQTLLIDGFNLIITIEVALSGGVLLVGTDGALRDLAGQSGGYRAVAETELALQLIDRTFGKLQPAGVVFYLDAPVSNSGRLRAHILRTVRSVPTEVRLLPDPDAALAGAAYVVSADSAVLDACESWVNLAGCIVEEHVPQAWCVALLGNP